MTRFSQDGSSMTIKELNKAKKPIVKKDKKLNKLADKVLFPEKLEAANKVLASAEPPKSPGRNTRRNDLRNGKTARLSRS